MAKGRLSSVETFWLMVGLSRFQSNVAITMMSTTINNKKTPITEVVILPVLVMFNLLTFFLACPKDSPAEEKEARYILIKATELRLQGYPEALDERENSLAQRKPVSFAHHATLPAFQRLRQSHRGNSGSSVVTAA